MFRSFGRALTPMGRLPARQRLQVPRFPHPHLRTGRQIATSTTGRGIITSTNGGRTIPFELRLETIQHSSEARTHEQLERIATKLDSIERNMLFIRSVVFGGVIGLGLGPIIRQMIMRANTSEQRVEQELSQKKKLGE